MATDKGDIGISPALLQAITQTLATSKAPLNYSEQLLHTLSNPATTSTSRNTVIVTTSDEDRSNNGQRMVIYEPDQPENPIVVYQDHEVEIETDGVREAEDDGGGRAAGGDVIVQSGNEYFIIRNGHVTSEGNGDTTTRFQAGDEIIYSENNEQYRLDKSTNQILILSPQSEEVITVADVNEAVASAIGDRDAQIDMSKSPPAVKGVCPICGDCISGYHYGIHTCESCKGFFKRSVQNKKAFTCHHNGSCDINMSTRKKCPACRLKKCVVAGMKLNAIRQDRQRGGRSAYPGNSRPRTDHRDHEVKKRYSMTLDATPSAKQRLMMASGTPGLLHKEDGMATEKATPKLLLEIESCERLLDDEEPGQCCQEKLTEGDPDLFSSLMHITEHKLHQIVKWTRKLPAFAQFDLSDQIALLHHAWSELLSLGAIWRSMDAEDEIRISFGKSISLEDAKKIGMEEVICKMLSIVKQFKRLEIDKYEFVAMKALTLITPDVNGLVKPALVRSYQEEISDALEAYSETRRPNNRTRFGEILLRLSEVGSLCMLGKYQIMLRASSLEAPSVSLLLECLSGSEIPTSFAESKEEARV